MAGTKMQIQRMKMRMKLPLKNETRYGQHFAKVNSEPCQAFWGAAFWENSDLKPLKTVIVNKSTLGIWQGSEHASSFAKLYIWEGVEFSE